MAVLLRLSNPESWFFFAWVMSHIKEGESHLGITSVTTFVWRNTTKTSMTSHAVNMFITLFLQSKQDVSWAQKERLASETAATVEEFQIPQITTSIYIQFLEVCFPSLHLPAEQQQRRRWPLPACPFRCHIWFSTRRLFDFWGSSHTFIRCRLSSVLMCTGARSQTRCATTHTVWWWEDLKDSWFFFSF